MVSFFIFWIAEQLAHSPTRRGDLNPSVVVPEMLKKLQAVNQPQAHVMRYSYNENVVIIIVIITMMFSRCLSYSLAEISVDKIPENLNPGISGSGLHESRDPGTGFKMPQIC